MTGAEKENRRETLACLTIDDPLLRPNHGCLNYKRLLQEMKDHDFFTEIAFIPWNYRRSDPEIVHLFAENPDRFALCVHGCNHTENEFGGIDYRKLRSLASTALWRMEVHKQLTGLPYDPVMIFPQGRFSSVAMQAIKDEDFCAAFNSTLKATDQEELHAGEYRLPATLKYHDIPLFFRRYPKDRFNFIEDVAQGRPIIIVEHHGAFRNGYREITDLVDWINGIGTIRWTSLWEIAELYSGEMAAGNPLAVEPALPYSKFDAKVCLRRFLSEFRDNHIETSSLMAKMYKLVRTRIALMYALESTQGK